MPLFAFFSSISLNRLTAIMDGGQIVKTHVLSANGRPGQLRPHGRATLIDEAAFLRTLCLERKRAERSRKLLLLMLLDEESLRRAGIPGVVPRQFEAAIASSTRETDIAGWYKGGSVVGVIFTELSGSDSDAIVKSMLPRVRLALQAHVGKIQADKIGVSFHSFPEEWLGSNSDYVERSKLYPDLSRENPVDVIPRIIKRMMDFLGSSAALILFAPVFLLIAAAIKLTSKGPAFFRQERIGRRGKPFICLKFRSMYTGTHSQIHQEYVKEFISGQPRREPGVAPPKTVYKIQNDPRVTAVGRLLRKTSLDELPQFLNVLRGEMSLVGPRPAIRYELELYDIWHRRRVLEVKPGITGLWQVQGRSKATFDEMVRLDLRYIRSRSLWLDITILLRTPMAVLRGEGAY